MGPGVWGAAWELSGVGIVVSTLYANVGYRAAGWETPGLTGWQTAAPGEPRLRLGAGLVNGHKTHVQCHSPCLKRPTNSVPSEALLSPRRRPP